jgi:hypothetical protein
MEKTYKNCQSCGMPLKRDEKGGGTNADGRKSTMFCSHCYENGKFTQPDITVRISGFSCGLIYKRHSEIRAMEKVKIKVLHMFRSSSEQSENIKEILKKHGQFE